MSPPADAIRWAAVVAAFVAAVGAFVHWGALSTVASQAEAVATTRVILGVLTASAAFIAIVAARERRLLWASAVLLVLAFLLGWTEWRYEAIQAAQRDLVTRPWGLWLVMAGSLAAAVASVLAFLMSRTARADGVAA